MIFQAVNVSARRNTGILINGTTYKADGRGCIAVENPADVAKLQAMSREWTTVVQDVAEVLPPAAPAMKDAAALAKELNSNEALVNKLAAMRSVATRRSFLESMGYRYTDDELRAEQAKLVPPEPTTPPFPLPPSDGAPEMAVGMPPAPEFSGDLMPPASAPAIPASAVPAVAVPPAHPKEGEEWPDPDEKQGLEYLKAMADAYEVKYSAKTKPAELVKKIHAAMYPT